MNCLKIIDFHNLYQIATETEGPNWYFQSAHYLNVAGCRGVVGSAGEGGVGDGVVLKGG